MIKFKTKKLKPKQKIAKPKIKVEPKIEEEPKIEKKNIFFIYHEVKKKNRFKLEKEEASKICGIKLRTRSLVL